MEHDKLVAELKAIKNKVSTLEKENSKMQSESRKDQAKLKSEMAAKEKDLESQLMQAQNRSAANSEKESELSSQISTL